VELATRPGVIARYVRGLALKNLEQHPYRDELEPTSAPPAQNGLLFDQINPHFLQHAQHRFPLIRIDHTARAWCEISNILRRLLVSTKPSCPAPKSFPSRRLLESKSPAWATKTLDIGKITNDLETFIPACCCNRWSKTVEARAGATEAAAYFLRTTQNAACKSKLPTTGGHIEEKMPCLCGGIG